MSATSEGTNQNRAVGQLLALSRNAHQHVDLDDPADYWYRLGQRNAYAHAVGLTLKATSSTASPVRSVTASTNSAP